MNEQGVGRDFLKIYSTPKHSEILLIKSILDGQGIPYYIKGENFGTLYGPADGLSSMDIMVKQENFEDAQLLLKELIEPKEKA